MIESHAAITFLIEMAHHLENRKTKEDLTYWANTANAETCRRIAGLIESRGVSDAR